MELTTPLKSLKEKEEAIFTIIFRLGKVTILEATYSLKEKQFVLEIFNCKLSHSFSKKA